MDPTFARAEAFATDPVDAVLARLADNAWSLSGDVLGHNVLDLCRRVRKELTGQQGRVPDLSSYSGRSHESVIAWEILPEIARRLIERTGVSMLPTQAEAKVPSMKIFSDADLRESLGEAMRLSHFAEAGIYLRQTPQEHPCEPGHVFVSEIFGNPAALGNVLEIAASRLCSPGSLAPERRDTDRLAQEISAHAAAAGRDDLAWSPDLRQAMLDISADAPLKRHMELVMEPDM